MSLVLQCQSPFENQTGSPLVDRYKSPSLQSDSQLHQPAALWGCSGLGQAGLSHADTPTSFDPYVLNEYGPSFLLLILTENIEKIVEFM